MTYLEKQGCIAYREERRRRKWEQDHMWWWFAAACLWLLGYVWALKAFGILD